MSWTDRIKEAAYISPSGKRVVFDFEDVNKDFEKRTVAFETSGKDGTYVQDSGRSGRRFPMRVFISGEDYDLAANAFEEALSERGAGKLEHPFYGTFDVVPFGIISRSDKLVSAGNQAVIDVLFWETTELFPQNKRSAAADVASSTEDFNEEMAEEFEKALDIDTAIEEVTFIDELKAALNATVNGLQVAFETVEEGLAFVEEGVATASSVVNQVQSKFEAVAKSINRGIDVLIDQPLALARQVLRLVQLPGQALTSITARLGAYGNLFNSLLVQVGIQEKDEQDSRNSNRFRSADLIASSYVTGSVISVINNKFETKSDAVAAAQVILEQFDELVQWRDDNYQSLEIIDTGDSYQQLLQTVSLTVGFLVELSFTLKQERRFRLTRSRNVIDLVAELYGEVDSQLDFFINSNNLTGSEILLIPSGREIVYYV